MHTKTGTKGLGKLITRPWWLMSRGAVIRSIKGKFSVLHPDECQQQQ
ncbi:MAG: hypothetical protein HOE45_09625 [Gammaproteobacteria bacterium]|nr:hypothetical protein [Gammaproteobacteria bacterium]MBT5967260.1 hypothetical protein [Gammaproteobacteria bacterium]MBT7436763.1 hypothetical protein [Gammaproteobacteria bacterium]